MSKRDNSEILSFTAPDITQADPSQTKKFSDTAPDYRTIDRGFNLEGKCKNKKCKAFNELVWTPVGYGTFQIGELIRNCKCPACLEPTRGNKMFGFYQAEITGYGMRKIGRANNEQETAETDDQDESQENQERQQTFPKIVHNHQEGFLKIDGKNGKLVQWYYMSLTIEKPQ